MNAPLTSNLVTCLTCLVACGTAAYLGAGWALDPHASARLGGAILAVLGVVGLLFFGRVLVWLFRTERERNQPRWLPGRDQEPPASDR